MLSVFGSTSLYSAKPLSRRYEAVSNLSSLVLAPRTTATSDIPSRLAVALTQNLAFDVVPVLSPVIPL